MTNMNDEKPAAVDPSFARQIERFALEQPDEFIATIEKLLSSGTNTGNNRENATKNKISSHLLQLTQQKQSKSSSQRKVGVVDDSCSSPDIPPTPEPLTKNVRPDIVLFHPATTTACKLPVSPDEAVPPSNSADEADGASLASSVWLHSPATPEQQHELHRRRSSSRAGSISMATATMNSAIANQLNNIDTDEWIRHRWLQHNRNEISDHSHLPNEISAYDVDETKRRTFENHKLRLRQLRMSKDVLTEDSLLRELIIDVDVELVFSGQLPVPGERELPSQTFEKSLQYLTASYLQPLTAKELDVDMLCCKVLQNVLALVNGDRGSLFLATSSAPGGSGGGGPVLVSQLFDITLETKWSDVNNHKKGTIVLPFGKGIAGRVAQTLTPISINDAYADPRFDKTVDKATGYHTRCLLCYPIISADHQLIGVAQIVNKQSPTETFTKSDEAVFAQYLVFCGIGLQNAQLFEVSLQEYRRNHLLLSLARSIFRQQLSIENMVRQIMQQCRTLVPCDCCWIMLLNTISTEAMQQEYAQFEQRRRKSAGSLWSLKQQFDNVDAAASKKKHYQNLNEIQFSEAYALPDDSVGVEVAVVSPADLDGSWILELSRAVVLSRRPIRMEKDTVENQSQTLAHHIGLEGFEAADSKPPAGTTGIDLKSTRQSFRNKSAFSKSLGSASTPEIASVDNDDADEDNDEKNYLAMPVFNAQQHVVATIIMEGRHELDEFGSNDMHMMEAFAIFCGLGITNAQLYEKALHWCARQQVALEVISYHALAPQAEVEQLVAAPILPANSWGLHSYKFDDAEMKNEQLTLQASMSMFADLNLISQFSVEHETLCRWVCSVRKNYRPVKYHNWRHAFNVAQTMYAMLVVGELKVYFDPLTIFGLLVAALCHDLGKFFTLSEKLSIHWKFFDLLSTTDHRGTNNAFQSLAGTGLAILYGTSVMEHHHFNQCMLLLSAPNNNIFNSLNTTQYKRLVGILERCILATDLAIFFKKKGEFNKMADEYQKRYKIIEDQAARQQQQQQRQADKNENDESSSSAVKRIRKFLRSSSSISATSSIASRAGSSSLLRPSQFGTPTAASTANEQPTPSFLYWRDSAAANTLLTSMLMTACDVSAIAKPWPIQREIARVVYDEFFDQGDLEKQAFGKISSDMLDRGKRADLPNMQVKFIDSVCEPLYKTLASMFPGVAPLYDGCKENRDHWLHETAKHAAESNGNNGIIADANIHQLPPSVVMEELEIAAPLPAMPASPATTATGISYPVTSSINTGFTSSDNEHFYFPTETSQASLNMEQAYNTLSAELQLPPRRSVSAHAITEGIQTENLRPIESNNGPHKSSSIELASRRRLSTIILPEESRRGSTTGFSSKIDDEEISSRVNSESDVKKACRDGKFCAATSAGSCVCSLQ